MSKYKTLSMAGALVASVVAVAAHAETLVITSWGGAYETSQRRAFSEPYAKANPDIQFTWEAKSNEALSNLRAQVEADNVTWDLVDILPAEAQIACDEGLLEPIDPSTMLANGADGSTPEDDFIPGALTECFVAEIVYSTIIAYNSEALKSKPRVIADVFDLEKFPGRRSLQKSPLNNLEWALAADGVPLRKIYDVLSTRDGVRRALSKLDTIKSQVIWWERAAQPPQLLADKEVVMGSSYNGRIFNAQIQERQPFVIIWDAQIFELDGFGIPKGRATPKVVDFLKYATDTQRLADMTKYISYGPARKSSVPLVDKHADTGIDMQTHMPTYGPNFAQAIPKDIEFWTDNQDELVQVFTAWLNR